MKIFHNKMKYGLVLMVVFAMIVQMIAPIASGYIYAQEENNPEEAMVNHTEEKEVKAETESSEPDGEEVSEEPQVTEEEKEEDNEQIEAEEGEDSVSAEPQEPGDNEKALEEIKGKEIFEETETEDIEATNLQEAREAQEITTNIIDDIRLRYKEDEEFKDFEEGVLVPLESSLRFDLNWSLPNDHKYKSGDFFKFKLPEQIRVPSQQDGNLGDYGSYSVDTSGNVVLTFNEKIENESEIKGDFWFSTRFEESKITSTEETIDIKYGDESLKEVTVGVKPKDGQDIHKSGVPVDGNFNTKEIKWTVLINTSREKLKDAFIEDHILKGQELMIDSISLEEVEVDLNGNVKEGSGKRVVPSSDSSTQELLKLGLGDTNKAYRLTFKTKLLEKDYTEGTKEYKNTAYLKSDGKPDAQAGGSVSVSRPESLKKTASNFNKADRSVEWTINANFTQQALGVDDVITDEFVFKVGEKEVKDIFEVTKDNISIVQVDSFNSDGTVNSTSDAIDDFDITIDENKVTYKLKNPSSKAYIIKYKTKAKPGAIINENGKISNSVTLKGKTKSTNKSVTQQVGVKSSTIDYENKEINWTITVNADKQDLKNFELTDRFAGSGQKLKEGTIKISPEKTGVTPSVDADKEGFKISFGDIKEKYTITYTTKFTYDFESGNAPVFKNGVDISYSSNDKDYTLDIGDKQNPNPPTKSNGSKSGKANNDKTITWTVDINYNQLSLKGASVEDTIPENQTYIDGSVKIYETSVAANGTITQGSEVTTNFTRDTDDNKVNITFGNIEKSYRMVFNTKDKDGIYNEGEIYNNTAIFKPGDGKEHNLTANVTLPNQGKFLGKIGVHNTADWTVDWAVDVNKSLSKMKNVKVTDDLGDTDLQKLLEDTIKVVKAGTETELVKGTDYKLSVEGNKFEIEFLKEFSEAYQIKYSSYILAEETKDIGNTANMQIGEEYVGTKEKTETIRVEIADSGGSGQGTTGGLKINKTEAGSNRALEGVEFKLIKTIGNEEIVVRQGNTDANGKLEWKGLKYGTYRLIETLPQGYTGTEEREVEISSKDPKGIKTINISNTRRTGTAKIIKVDSVTGETLEGAEFTLKNQTTGQEYPFTTDGDGVILEEIPFGEYTVKEITAPEGYRITTDIPNVTVEIGKTATITIENVAFVDVSGQKTWFVDKDKELPENITVVLLADGKNIAEQKVTKDNNWKYNFKDLDKYNKADREIKYEIKELDIYGYITKQDGYDLTNIQTTNVSGTKTWVDDNNPDRPESITVQLLANGEKLENKTAEVSEATNWEYAFNDLPKYDTDGEKITYAIEELIVEGYEAEINDFDITNTRKATTSVKGEKTWKDEEPTDRPQEIKVDLTREVKGEKDKEFSESKTVKSNVKGKWLYEFENLPEFNENGVAYTYIIKEDNVPTNYESTVDEYDITNVRVGKTEISGKKRWKDDKIEDRPKSITVNLLRNNVSIQTKKVTADDNWKYSFEGLDKYDEDGKYYNYTVKEEQVPGYAPTIKDYDITNTRAGKTSIEIKKGWLDDNSKDRPDSIIVFVYQNKKLFDTVKVEADKDWVYELKDLEAYDEDGQPYKYTIKEKDIENYKTTIDGFNITNLRAAKTDITANKVWIDGPDVKPTIELQLYRNGEAYGKPVELKNGTTEYTWTDLDKYDKVGKEYVYEVKEVGTPENYEKTEEGLTVTNKYVSPKTEVKGTKKWIDGPEVKPTIELQLYRNGEAYGKPVELKNGTTEYTWTDLDLTDKNGTDYVYTVKEVGTPENYEKTEEGLTVTNKYVSPKTEVKGTKKWIDGPEVKPTIELQLYRNGEAYGKPVELKDGETEYTWTDLDLTDKDGKEYDYTVKEVNVPENYSKSVSEDGLTVTNKYVSPKTEIKGTKKWIDGPEVKPTIELQLYRNGEAYGKPVELKNGTTEYTWTDLDKYDKVGKEYVYEVKEVGTPENYEKTEEGLTVTNKYVSPKTEVKGTKKWIDGPEVKPTIELQLYRNGEAYGKPVELKNGTTEYKWTDLDKTDKQGKNYLYEVKEVGTPENYEKTEEGLTVTNKYVSPKTEVKGTKKWVDGPEVKPTIELQLYRNGEAYGKPVELKNGITEYTWTDLDLTDKNGTDYVYTVKEVGTPENYEKTEEGLTVTNKYVSPKTEVKGTKKWVDGPEVKPTIELQLYRNGEAYGKPVELKNGTTEYTWTDLNLTDKNGTDYVYTVKEVGTPENYEKTEEGLTVTNKYVSPKTEVKGTKKWVDGPEVKPTIELQLYRNGEAYGKPVELKNGTTEYTWTDLNLTDKNGTDYVYTVDEVNIPENYSKSVSEDGLTIINKYIEPTKPTYPDKPEKPEKPEKPSKPGKPGDHKDDDLVQTGTDINFLIPIGFILMLIGIAFVYKEKKIKEK